LTGGYSFGAGGGAYGGTLNNCTLSYNTCNAGLAGGGGGAVYCTLNNCTLVGNAVINGPGGGAYYCTLNNCALTGNQAGSPNIATAYGGGAAYCTLNNCTLTRNSAAAGLAHGDSAYGGGTYYCTLNNCTLVSNSSDGTGGGASHSTLKNCILDSNVPGGDYDTTCHLDFCCAWPLASIAYGRNNITHPLLDYGNLHLQSNSPCINAGNNALAPAGSDLDGNPRIIGGTVDIGAYEFQSLSLINFGVVSNQAAFNITGQSNQVVLVQTSSDLVNWSPLATNTLNGHPFPFSDPTPATLPRRFYRAQTQ
jgi:hypothetical protein